MIEAAGGEPVLANAGMPSARVHWDEIGRAEPDVVVFMPCGYDLDGAVDEARRSLLSRPELRGGFVAVHANAYFSRPGPRLVDGVEILAAALHPDAVAAPAEGTFARLR
jgi:iron complex transport system substrate-binding protein